MPLDEAQQREFQQLLTTEIYHEGRAMNKTWYEKGIEKERRASLRELLEERFGPLSPEVLTRLDLLPFESLMPLRQAVYEAQSLSELGL